MDFLCHIFLCLHEASVSGCKDNLARGVLFLLSAEYSVVICGARPGTLVTWLWLRLCMVYCCALRLWSQICITCRSCWFPDPVTLTFYAGARCLEPEGWLHAYEMVMEHFANTNLSVLQRNAAYWGVWCETEPLCQSLLQPWPRWLDVWLFTASIAAV